MTAATSNSGKASRHRKRYLPRFTNPGLFLLFIAMVITGCSGNGGQEEEKVPPVPVSVGRVQQIDALRTVSVSGTLTSPYAPAHASFLVDGRVEKVLPREGTYVHKGSLLASLDTTDYRNAAASATAQAAQARVAAERAKNEYDRMAYLFKRQSLARNDFEKYKAASDAAALQLQEALAAEKIHKKRLADTSLHAPVAGFISKRLVEPGQTAAAGKPAFEIVRLDPVEVLAGVPETDIQQIRVGQTARVTLPALAGQDFEGRVRVINISADPGTRTYMTRIAIPNPDHALRLGMVAKAEITTDKKIVAMVLPISAIVHDPQGAPLVYIYYADQKRVYSKRVTLGGLLGDKVEIKNGVSPDDAIVMAGQEKLRNGVEATIAAHADTAQ